MTFFCDVFLEALADVESAPPEDVSNDAGVLAKPPVKGKKRGTKQARAIKTANSAFVM